MRNLNQKEMIIILGVFSIIMLIILVVLMNQPVDNVFYNLTCENAQNMKEFANCNYLEGAINN